MTQTNHLHSWVYFRLHILNLISKCGQIKGDCSWKSRPNFRLFIHVHNIMGRMGKVSESVFQAQPTTHLWYTIGLLHGLQDAAHYLWPIFQGTKSQPHFLRDGEQTTPILGGQNHHCHSLSLFQISDMLIHFKTEQLEAKLRNFWPAPSPCKIKEVWVKCESQFYKFSLAPILWHSFGRALLSSGHLLTNECSYSAETLYSRHNNIVKKLL